MAEYSKDNGQTGAEKIFRCEDCGKGYQHRWSLLRHKKIKREGKAFKCNICEKQFTYKQNLELHKVVHTGERPLNAVIATRVMLRKVSWRDTFTLIPEQNRFSVVIAARSLENRHIFTPTSNCTRRNVLTHATNVVADLLQQGHWRNTIEGIQGKDLSSARCVENASSMVATNYHCIWEHTLVKGHLNVTIVGKVSVIVVVFHAIRKSMPRRSILNASSVARCINI